MQILSPYNILWLPFPRPSGGKAKLGRLALDYFLPFTITAYGYVITLGSPRTVADFREARLSFQTCALESL